MLLTDDKIMANYMGKRKHHSQMTGKEINGLFTRLKSVERDGFRWRIAGHALDRLNEKKINATYNDIVSAIYDSNIVEYKIDKNKYNGKPEERVVIASNQIVNDYYRLKAVFSLTERRIVTVWINHIKDKHATLKWELYTADMPVFGV